MTHTNEHHRLICENCQADQFKRIFAGSDKLLGIPGEFVVCECESCGLFQISPKLSVQEIDKYYPEDYICYLEAIEDEKNPLVRFNRYLAQEKRCRQVIRRTKKTGKILDVGCATGIFLNQMQKKGWICQGVETDLEAVNYAKNRFGLDVFHGVLEDSKLPSNSFDVVTLWDVLEHVYDLKATLLEIIRILKPGGFMIATLPNADAFERYIFGEYWVGWEIPRHYRTFNRRTIVTFLKQNNFDEIKIFSFTGRHGAFMLSMAFWINERNIAGWMKKIILAVAGSFIIRLFTLPLFIVVELLNRSTVMSFSARKGNVDKE